MIRIPPDQFAQLRRMVALLVASRVAPGKPDPEVLMIAVRFDEWIEEGSE